MTATLTFRMPDVGEGLVEAEILAWLVAVGDTVTDGQPVCEVETAKAAVELPIPYDGTVAEILSPPGTTVEVGAPIITVRPAGTGRNAEPAAGPAQSGDPGPAPDGAVLVGYGPRTNPAPTRRRRKAPTTASDLTGTAPTEPLAAPVATAPLVAPVPTAADVPTAAIAPTAVDVPTAAIAPTAVDVPTTAIVPTAADVPTAAIAPTAPLVAPAATTADVPTAAIAPTAVDAATPVDAPTAGVPVRAKPPVRKLAKELGVDLSAVSASGPHGVVTREDVLAAAASGSVSASVPGTAAASGSVSASVPGTAAASGPVSASVPETAAAPEPVPMPPPGAAPAPAPRPVPVRDGAHETRIPVRGVRRATARAMVASAFTAPHVTEFVDVDVSRTMKLVRRLRNSGELGEVPVGPLLFVAAAYLAAVRRHPGINASWDEENQEIVLRHQVNLGIAAATERGLIVPNIKDAGRLTLTGLADALGALVRTARAGRAAPGDLTGGTTTITNIGVYGVDGGTPLLNPGEAAILAVGAIRTRPWVHKGRVVPREVATLSLSFDHRLVDGELGSKVLADTAAALEHPRRLLWWR
ncbi:2-oxo acid dehydrogenase subunit E2 [Streptomyces sp. NPDC059787]|uniref:dihydrolipoamide acetyltransferase family protein n=1 Tax=Streptomyces sp. NPDC059787 TaxID=3346947 RepID=UPI00365FA631